MCTHVCIDICFDSVNMAACQSSENNEFIVCSICLQIFTAPKYLPCLHTFCELCLQGWIQSQVTVHQYSIRNVSFRCPVCQTLTHLPSGTNKFNQDQWASKFPGNHIIVSLIDKYMIEKERKCCDSCTEMGKSVHAINWCVQCSEAYCESCTKVHRSMKVGRKHKIIGLEDVLGDLKCLSSDEMCDEHTDEVIKLYCVGHARPCCTVCGATTHRKCENIMELSEAARGIKEKSEYHGIVQNLQDCEDKIKDTASKFDENLKQLRKKYEDIKHNSDKLVDEINICVKKLHRDFMKDLSKSYDHAAKEITTNSEMCLSKRRMISNCRQMLDKAEEHSGDKELFLQMKRTEEKLKEGKDFIDNSMTRMKGKQLSHSFGEQILSFKNVKSFGNVNETSYDCIKK